VLSPHERLPRTGMIPTNLIARQASWSPRAFPVPHRKPCGSLRVDHSRRARTHTVERDLPQRLEWSRPEIAHVRGWSRGPLGFPRSMVDAEELPVFQPSQTHAHRHRWAARVVLGRPRPEITFLPASRERPSHARTTVPDYPVLVWIATRW